MPRENFCDRPMWFVALLLHTSVYNGIKVVTGTTKGNKNHCVAISIIIVTDWLGGIVEWDDEEGTVADTEIGFEIMDNEECCSAKKLSNQNLLKMQQLIYSWWQKYNQSTNNTSCNKATTWLGCTEWYFSLCIFLKNSQTRNHLLGSETYKILNNHQELVTPNTPTPPPILQ